MTEITENAIEKNMVFEPQNPSNCLPKLKKRVREIFALFLWVYLFIKLFIFDFDVYFVETYLSSFLWVVRYKFFIFLGFFAAYLLVVGERNLFKVIGYVFVFPFLCFWWVLKLLFRSWFFTFATISIASSFFQSLKYNIVEFSLILIGTVLTLLSGQYELIIIINVILFLCLFWHISKKLLASVSSSQVLFLPKESIFKLLNNLKEVFKLPVELKSTTIEKYTPEQKNKWNVNLQFLVICNKATLFLASKLEELQERGYAIFCFLLSFFYSVFICVWVFALNNYALYLFAPSSFQSATVRGFPFFLYYSLSAMVNNGLADFNPISIIAGLLKIVEVCFGILFLVILISLYFNVGYERSKKEMDALITDIKQQGKELELFVNREFLMDITQAVEEIKKIPNNFIKVVYFLSTNKY